MGVTTAGAVLWNILPAKLRVAHDSRRFPPPWTIDFGVPLGRRCRSGQTRPHQLTLTVADGVRDRCMPQEVLKPPDDPCAASPFLLFAFFVYFVPLAVGPTSNKKGPIISLLIRMQENRQ
jgi:hypothetical protein